MKAYLLVLCAVVVACGPSVRNEGDGGGNGDGGGGMCTNGVTRCTGNSLETCVDGQFEMTQSCPDVCVDSLGCVLCQPGTGTCEGSISHACRPDGMGYTDVFCDSAQGVTCDFKSGICEGACAPANIG